jgi:hypothetical protein
MTDQQTKDMRERFEAWYRKDISADADFTFSLGYTDWEVSIAHQAWEAALSQPTVKDSLPVADEAVAWRYKWKSLNSEWQFTEDSYFADPANRANGFMSEPLYTRPSPLPSVPVESAYELGFRRAAEWAGRDDLKFDTDSPAYLKDRDKDLTAFLSQLGAEQ